MILEYHRPEQMNEALELIAREHPRTVPLGGGTNLSQVSKPDLAVVDLQRLGLNTMRIEGQMLHIGATVTLQSIMDAADLPDGVRAALQASLGPEAGLNLRQMATIGGTIASCDGRSPFVTALLALDPRLVWQPGESVQALGDFLPLRQEQLQGRMIVEVRVPLNASLRFEMVARTPLDRPIVCAAVATWPSGRTRVTLGGYGSAPILAMDGPEPAGAAAAARDAFHNAEDAWASAEYRVETAAKLVQRMLRKQEAR